MNHAEYILSDEHQSNIQELRTKCGGLVTLAEFLKRYADITDLDSLRHFLPQFILEAAGTLNLTQKMRESLREAQEASE